MVCSIRGVSQDVAVTASRAQPYRTELAVGRGTGGETITLRGRSIAEEIVNFARQWNVSKIVSGKPVRSRWKDIFCKSPVDELVRMSGDIDIYVITGEPGEPRESTYLFHPKHIPLSDYAATPPRWTRTAGPAGPRPAISSSAWSTPPRPRSNQLSDHRFGISTSRATPAKNTAASQGPSQHAGRLRTTAKRSPGSA